MKLGELKENWEIIGREDPLWGVLSDPSKKGNKWDENEFFNTGKKEITELLNELQKLKVSLEYDECLDFGCGVGRLSFALLDHFKTTTGVDISSSMIEKANYFNKNNSCIFILNCSDNLGIFNNEKFSFIYTNLVLQHMKPKYSKKYILEFFRILKQSGILIFQIPHKNIHFFQRFFHFVFNNSPVFIKKIFVRWRSKGTSYIEMYKMKKEKVIRFLIKSKYNILDVSQSFLGGKTWITYKYICQKG